MSDEIYGCSICGCVEGGSSNLFKTRIDNDNLSKQNYEIIDLFCNAILNNYVLKEIKNITIISNLDDDETEDLHKLLDLLGLRYDYDEYSVCHECGEETEFIMIDSTER